MKITGLCILMILTVAAILAGGCSSSDQSTQTQQPDRSVLQPPPAQRTEVKQAPQPDTVNVTVQNTERPKYDPAPGVTPQPQSTESPTGRYSVQLGAYKMPDNADRIASLARERFGLKVYSIYDKADNLYKVMVGDFAVKDDARAFRDRMVMQFPTDYKDAWVSENAAK